MAQQRKRGKRLPRETPPTTSKDATPPNRDRMWLSLIVVGVLLRLGLASISIGTNDAAAWLRFGDEINQQGLLKTYSTDPDFNHPPLPGYWAALCARIAGDGESPLHDSIFTFVFKLAPIVGDCLAMYVLFLIWRRLRGRSHALGIAAAFALSLDAILVSGFHCNTDSLLIAVCMLSIYLQQDRDRPLLSGMALAGAINIKLIPVLLIPAMVLRSRSWRSAGLLVLGLGAGVLPFIPALLGARATFLANVLRYNSMIDRWGINFFLLLDESTWVPGHRGEALSTAYYSWARYLILGLTALWAVVGGIKPRWTLYEMAFVTFAILLLLAPGFGVQYTVLAGVPLFAIRPRWAVVYAALAGFFVGSAYVLYWTGTFPLYSHWGVLFPEPAGTLGLLTWLMLLVLLCLIVIRPTSLAGDGGPRHNPANP
jgi:hypothetical protein